jgi:hypothetical protein
MMTDNRGIMRLIHIATTLAVVALLATLTSTATAGRLSYSNQTFRATFNAVRFYGGWGGSECSVTLEGSMHTRTAIKSSGALISYINRAVIGSCSFITASLLAASLPWHVRYASFSGTLPNITRINSTFVGMQFEIREPAFGVRCLASGGTVLLNSTREGGGVLTSAELGGTQPTNCGIEIALSGTSNSFTVLGAATRIAVTLI